MTICTCTAPTGPPAAQDDPGVPPSYLHTLRAGCEAHDGLQPAYSEDGVTLCEVLNCEKPVAAVARTGRVVFQVCDGCAKSLERMGWGVQAISQGQERLL